MTFPKPKPVAPIGLFDSGLGGLSVLHQLHQQMPSENYVYFGDTKHMPYGEKPMETVIELLNNNLHWLVQEQGVKCVVLGCSTSSAPIVLKKFSVENQFPQLLFFNPVQIMGAAVVNLPYKKIGVIATPTTVASGQFTKVIAEHAPHIEVMEIPCEGLAKAVETGQTVDPAFDEYLSDFLNPLLNWGAQAIILGCTHYVFVAQFIQKIAADNTVLLDPAVFAAPVVREALLKQNLLTETKNTGAIRYTVSQDPPSFFRVASGLPLKGLPLAMPELVHVLQKENSRQANREFSC